MLEIDIDKIHEVFNSSSEIRIALDEIHDFFKFRTIIHHARHYSDLTQDCLEAIYIGNQLCQFCNRIKVTKESCYMYDSIIEFTLQPNDTTKFSELIFKFGLINNGEDEDENLNIDFYETLSEYRDKLEDIEHVSPFVAVNMFEITTLRHDSIKNQPYSKIKAPKNRGEYFLGSVVVR